MPCVTATQVDLLNQELWRCQTEREAERRCLETKVEDQRLRLEGYERVERDMDDIVMQAAQGEGTYLIVFLYLCSAPLFS